MIDVRIDSIIYQSQVYYANLVNEIVEKKKLGKANDHKWAKADTISGYLDALNYRIHLTDEEDITEVNYILECLIQLCELNQYPVSAPIEFQEPPAVMVGVKGDKGDTGDTGATGATGLATDFQVTLITTPSVVDSFAITDAKGARWDYVVIKSTGEQRAGQVIGSWLDDGSLNEIFDSSTEDISGPTSDLEFEVEFLAGNIRLIAVPAAGNWTVIGTRYFIPNNGNGSGPISDALPNGTLFIGNASNLAQSRSMSGDVTITNTGVTSITAGVVVDADINAAAAITLSKLAPLTASRIAASDGSGVITTLDPATYPSLTELTYVKGVTSAIQTQINTKLTDPTTTIGDIIIRDGSNTIARLPIGSAGQVLTVSGGTPSWEDPTGSLLETIIDIGDWDMNTTTTITVPMPVDRTKVRGIHVEIKSDDLGGGEYWTTPLLTSTGTPGGTYTMNQNGTFTPANEIVLFRTVGGAFDNSAYDATSYNRGWIIIKHIP